MSSIGTGPAGADARIARLTARSANIANAEASALAAAESGKAAQRAQAASRDATIAPTARDPRFDPPATDAAEATPNVEVVRQIAHQIAARLAYRTSVTVVRTNDRTIHASIDVSA